MSARAVVVEIEEECRLASYFSEDPDSQFRPFGLLYEFVDPVDLEGEVAGGVPVPDLVLSDDSLSDNDTVSGKKRGREEEEEELDEFYAVKKVLVCRCSDFDHCTACGQHMGEAGETHAQLCGDCRLCL